MKKIRIEKGRLIAYVQQHDIETLVSTAKTLQDLRGADTETSALRCEGILEEEAVLKGECNEDGYYRISKLQNVNFIKNCPYIPHYDYLLKLNKDEIEELADKADCDNDLLDILVTRGYRRGSSISPKNRHILNCIKVLDDSTVEKLEEVSKDKMSAREPAYTNVTNCLRRQVECYSESLGQMLEMKKDETKSKNSCFILKKIRKFLYTQ